jgi:hypothetical protein
MSYRQKRPALPSKTTVTTVKNDGHWRVSLFLLVVSLKK